ncbi:MAG: STAS/SEC14 domain-containing protein [Janthinobacterium lividum]
MLLFDNPAGQVLADPAGFLCTRWAAGPRTLADTQAIFSHIAQALAQRRWSKVLINQGSMQSFSAAEQEWVAQQWLPQAVQESGYRYGAVVVSPDTYTRLATAYITTNVQGLPLRYRSFDTEEAAEAWLRQLT